MTKEKIQSKIENTPYWSKEIIHVFLTPRFENMLWLNTMTFILYLHIELDSICMPIHHQHALTSTIFSQRQVYIVIIKVTALDNLVSLLSWFEIELLLTF